MATLELTDGTTTVDLWSGVVKLSTDVIGNGWPVKIAGRRASELAGLGEWADVDEEIPILGDGAAIGAELAKIQMLLAQAERWAAGDPAATAVRLRARVDGTALGSVVLEAAVLAGGVQDMSAGLFQTYQSNTIRPTLLRLRRRGAWLNPTYDTAASSASASQAVKTITWPASHPNWSPMSLALTFSGAAGVVGNLRGFVLVGTVSTAFTILNAETFTGTNLSSVANTPALNGAYLRYLPSTVTVVTSSWQTLTNPSRAFDVYAVAEAVGQDFTIQATARKAIAAGGATITSQAVTIPAGATNVFYLGRFDGGAVLLDELRLRLTTAATHGSNQLRIDTVVIHADEGPGTKAIYVPYGAGSGSGGAAGQTAPLGVRNEPLAYPAPIVGLPDHASPFGDQAPLIYNTTSAGSIGFDPILPADGYLQTKGATVAVLPLLMEISSSPPNWRPQYSGAAANIIATGRRYKAYLALE